MNYEDRGSELDHWDHRMWLHMVIDAIFMGYDAIFMGYDS